MKKTWSISTTVRNPERLREFLRTLKLLEGEPFNSENQIKYQILLIQNKLYKPSRLTREQEKYVKDVELEMPFSVAEAMFNAQNYKDPAMRGRNSVAPLNKMGLCIAKNSAEGVKITPLGEYLLSEDFDLGKLFFFHFLKWQLPNPDSRTFAGKDGFAIKPFIGALHLINEVNKKWVKLRNEPIGMSKEEFSLFAPTLIDYREIAKQAGKVIEYRIDLRKQKTEKDKKSFREKYKKALAQAFLKTKKASAINKLLHNLKDYGDNAVRYFRLTRFIYIRGGGFYIDLEPRRVVEIEKLLLSDNAAPLKFKSADEYIDYLADLNQPVLPWETEPELRKISLLLSSDINNLIKDLESKSLKVPAFSFKDTHSLNVADLKQYIEELRTFRRKLQEEETHLESQDITRIQEYINAFKNIHHSSNKKSIELEKLAALTLNALNDALEIKPNYPVGDDNEPTFTAPPNKADIECFYERFNSVCEVTMLTDRSQWYHEGQPVMRHVRDFERTHANKTVYALFVAPRLHQDTVETFWMSIKYGYKGSTQRIIPFSITQFIKLLEILLEIRKQGRKFYHYELLELYDQIIGLTGRVAHSDEWIEQIPNVLSAWQNSILSKK